MPEIKIRGKEYVIKDGITIIGRSDDADIQIDSTKLSRAHARFIIEGGRIFIEDLGSKNGTLVNGRLIQGKREILKGDKVKIADIDVEIVRSKPVLPVQKAQQSSKPFGGKAARRPQRKQKEMIKNIVIFAVLAVAGLAGLSYYKNYVPKEQKQAVQIVKDAEEQLSSAELSDEITKNSKLKNRLSGLKNNLEQISDKFQEEHTAADRLIQAIDKKVTEIETRNSELQRLQESLTLFAGIRDRVADGTLGYAEAVSSLKNLQVSYPGTDAAQKALAKMQELNQLMLEDELSVIARAKSKAKTLTASGKFKEALSVIDECTGREFLKAGADKISALSALKPDIMRKARNYFSARADKAVEDARTGDCTNLKQALKAEYDRIGLAELEKPYIEAAARIDEIKAERIAQAKERLHKELIKIEQLEKKRMYEDALTLYEGLVQKITEPELNKEVEKRKRLNDLLMTAKRGIIKLVNEKGGVEVMGFGFIKSLSEREVKLQIEDRSMPLGWDKLRDNGFLMLLSKAVSKYADASLYTAYAVLLLKKKDIAKADKYLSKALSASSDLLLLYPDIFSEHTQREAMKKEEEKKREAEFAIRREREKAQALSGYVPERPWTFQPEMGLTKDRGDFIPLTQGPLSGPIETSLKGVHPRIFLTAKKLAYLRKTVKSDPKWTKMYDMLMIKVRKYAKKDPPDTGRESIDDAGEQNWQRNVGDIMPHFALAYLLTDNKQYLESAKKYMFKSLSYKTWGTGKFEGVDLAAGHQLNGIGLAYDWLFHHLTQEERDEIREKLTERARVMAKAAQSKRSFMQNHLWVDCGGLATAAFAICDEVPEANAWIRIAHSKFVKTLETVGDDGASHEGYGYWIYGCNPILQYMEQSYDLLGIDLYHSKGIDHPWLVNNILYALYLRTPCKIKWKHSVLNFADVGALTYSGPTNILRNLARRFPDQPYASVAQWLARDMEAREDEGSWRSFLNFVWFDPSIPEKSPKNLPTMHHFNDMDIVVSRSGWDGNETVLGIICGPPQGHKHVKASRSYGVGHVHPDAAHFLLHSRGEILVRDDGYALKKRTDAHNTVLINGKGQIGEGAYGFSWKAFKSAGGTPRIISVESSKSEDIIVCDATKAYPSSASLKTFRRTFCFAKPDAILITDILIADKPVEFDWRLNLEGTLEKKADWYYCLTKNNVSLDIGIIFPKNANISIINISKKNAWTGEQTKATPALSIKPVQKTARAQFVILLRVRDKDDKTLFAPVVVKQNVYVQVGKRVVELVTSPRKDKGR